MDSLVSTAWLANELGAADLVVLDAGMHLPDAGRDAAAEFVQGHIPGARFLDLAGFVDPASDVPKAVPTAAQFADRMARLGIAPGTRVVLYDDSAIKSAARAWFIFTHHRFGRVAILDGGLAKWRREGRPIETGPAVEVEPVAFPPPQPSRRIRTKREMLANCASGAEQVIDARDAARFAGEAGSGSEGHIPGSANLHFPRLFAADGTYLAPAELAEAFASEGIDLARPVTTCCNSGMTAAVLLFGLHLAGKDDGALYDGSWLEWGADPQMPKEKG